ncbi:chromosomal replication initiator protein DnaA [Desulfofarcimen acetoxidans DSM 771]|uniref:Chromosomal replication initiator protein DnaA n=1 Tax=Desulfofarcimen acetoxidans (strain ATCC 49208 / DSM 771 / KCTC 5769 / VKM B-1644 / 5575) TaxID=485916 RepID=C8VV97_DESAS|nr:chromosomal replication initiator protein DnaA [Desulfofarcimen acetoxidans]ACV60966.1 chromosomal replication initiator protein DnaA [Desulfofarcimen acetoxidans DSM 771]
MKNTNVKNIWEELLISIKNKVSQQSYDLWINSLNPIGLHNNVLTIEVSDNFTKDWINDRYYPLLKSNLRNVLKTDTDIQFILAAEVENYLSQHSLEKVEEAKEDIEYNTNHIKSKYTFDTFVVGDSNRFAHAACFAVAESPAKSYNPLFIYGGVGLGKTHLMHAIAHYILTQGTGSKVVYVTSEKFTNELINSFRDDQTIKFRNKYRSMNILLIDDIQFLAGKERTQEEFFHTFNTLYEANKQIIISSDRPPKEIPTLEDRLRSRFEWGLITDIQAPDYETRIAILRKKAQVDKLYIPDEVINFIATKIKSNIRELEGCLIRIIAYASFTKKEMNVELAEQVLKDILNPKTKQITVELIQKSIAEHFEIKSEELKAKNRSRTISHPRQIAMYLARELTDLSLPKIGEAFGGRDHTTVLHAHEKIKEQIKKDGKLENTLKELINKLQ